MTYILALMLYFAGLGPNPDAPPPPPAQTSQDDGLVRAQGGGIPTTPPSYE